MSNLLEMAATPPPPPARYIPGVGKIPTGRDLVKSTARTLLRHREEEDIEKAMRGIRDTPANRMLTISAMPPPDEDPERELRIRQKQDILEYIPTAPLRSIAAGVLSRGAGEKSRIQRYTGFGENADETLEEKEEMSEARARTDPSRIAGWMESGTDSLIQAFTFGRFGLPATAAAFASDEHNQSLKTASDMGLEGSPRQTFAAKKGAWEGIATLGLGKLLGKFGFSTVEAGAATKAITKSIAKQTLPQVGKSVLKTGAAESVEEVITEAGHAVIEDSTFDNGATNMWHEDGSWRDAEGNWAPGMSRLFDTIGTAVMMGGMQHTPSAVAAVPDAVKKFMNAPSRGNAKAAGMNTKPGGEAASTKQRQELARELRERYAVVESTGVSGESPAELNNLPPGLQPPSVMGVATRGHSEAQLNEQLKKEQDEYRDWATSPESAVDFAGRKPGAVNRLLKATDPAARSAQWKKAGLPDVGPGLQSQWLDWASKALDPRVQEVARGEGGWEPLGEASVSDHPSAEYLDTPLGRFGRVRGQPTPQMEQAPQVVPESTPPPVVDDVIVPPAPPVDTGIDDVTDEDVDTDISAEDDAAISDALRSMGLEDNRPQVNPDPDTPPDATPVGDLTDEEILDQVHRVLRGGPANVDKEGDDATPVGDSPSTKLSDPAPVKEEAGDEEVDYADMPREDFIAEYGDQPDDPDLWKNTVASLPGKFKKKGFYKEQGDEEGKWFHVNRGPHGKPRAILTVWSGPGSQGALEAEIVVHKEHRNKGLAKELIINAGETYGSLTRQFMDRGLTKSGAGLIHSLLQGEKADGPAKAWQWRGEERREALEGLNHIQMEVDPEGWGKLSREPSGILDILGRVEPLEGVAVTNNAKPGTLAFIPTLSGTPAKLLLVGKKGKQQRWRILDGPSKNVIGNEVEIHADNNVGLLVEITGEKPPAFTPEDKHEEAVEFFADHFNKNGSYRTIIEAREKYTELTGVKTHAGMAGVKKADEAVEQGLVRAAKEIVDSSKSSNEAFDRLVDLYKRQPNLASRTTDSIKRQAYSTPVPLAYLASQLAEVDENSSVYDSSAGNGALLIGGDLRRAQANEIDPERADSLERLGVGTVTRDDASSPHTSPGQQFDAVIVNPPFGTVRDNDGNGIDFNVDGLETNQIDHAIALNALASMKDDGKAVLILGSKIPGRDKKGKKETKAQAYLKGNISPPFYKKLYDTYNVTDHFTVDGGLYSKQGASFPIDVIVIDGKGESTRKPPWTDEPKIFKTWREIKNEKLADQPKAAKGVVTGPAGRDSDRPVSRGKNPDVGPVPRPTPGKSKVDGGRVRRPAEDIQSGVVGSGDDTGGRPDRKPRSDRTVRGDDVEHVPTPRKSVPDESSERTDGSRGDADERSGDVADAPAPRKRRPVNKEVETEHQVSYEPSSDREAVGTLVPPNLKGPISDALSRVEAAHGNIDKFVMKELGWNRDQLGNLYAEQVDAVALAIYNHQNGSAMIVGDQTGIGKGRSAAAMIRYARRQGLMPVFVTESPNLFGDMIRDLTGIEMNSPESPFHFVATNNTNVKKANIPLPDGRTLKSTDKENQEMIEAASALVSKGKPTIVEMGRGKNKKEEEVQAIFTTYSQLQEQGKGDTWRHVAMRNLMPNSFLILDESHKAGGTQKTGREKKLKEGEIRKTPRSEFIRELVQSAKGVTYLSATFAKRHDVMDLYSRTDMPKAVGGDVTKLASAINSGGVPMLQVTSAMLGEAGQMIRRERTWDGVEIVTAVSKIDRVEVDGISTIFRSIRHFDDAVQGEMDGIIEGLTGGGEVMARDSSTGDAGINSTSFSSIMHNLVDQMLLVLKADSAADAAIEAVERKRNGKSAESPVIVVDNTLGAFLKDHIKQNNLSEGDPVTLSFKDMLKTYLRRSREVTIKDPTDPKSPVERRYLSDNQIGEEAVKRFKETEKIIDELNFNGPASPIDWVRYRLGKAGISVAEITGRDHTIEYSGEGKGVLGRKSEKEAGTAGKVNTVEGFNEGRIEVMIINRSGATGLSAHASKDFGNQNRRHMIILQAAKNIDEFIQIMGRIHRTGQVVAPKFTLLMTDAPAEKRPASVLVKKLAKLNASVTGKSKGILDFDVPDIMNVVGDQVVANYLSEDADMWFELGQPEYDRKSGAVKPSEGLAQTVTGRTSLLPLKKQEEFWDSVTEMFSQTIKELDSLNENPLSAKSLPLEAKRIEKFTIFEGKEDDGPFAEPASLEQVTAKKLGKPLSPDEIKRELQELYEIDNVENIWSAQSQWRRSTRDTLFTEKEEYLHEVTSKMTDENAIDRRTALSDTQSQIVTDAIQIYPPGTPVTLMSEGDSYKGVVIGFKRRGKGKNPVAPSSWSIEVAIDDASQRAMVPVSQAETRLSAIGASSLSDTLMSLDNSAKVSHEKRWIATGNLLAAYSQLIEHKGRITFFTDDQGQTRHGVIMPRSFSALKWAEERPVTFQTPETAMKFIKDKKGILWTPDNAMSILSLEGGGALILKADISKLRGRRHWGNEKTLKAAGGIQFNSSGSWMKMTIPRGGPQDAVLKSVMSETVLQATVDRPQARDVLGITKTGEKIGDESSMGGVDDDKSIGASKRKTVGTTRAKSDKPTEGYIDDLTRLQAVGTGSPLHQNPGRSSFSRVMVDQYDDERNERGAPSKEDRQEWIDEAQRRFDQDPEGEAEKLLARAAGAVRNEAAATEILSQMIVDDAIQRAFEGTPSERTDENKSLAKDLFNAHRDTRADVARALTAVQDVESPERRRQRIWSFLMEGTQEMEEAAGDAAMQLKDAVATGNQDAVDKALALMNRQRQQWLSFMKDLRAELKRRGYDIENLDTLNEILQDPIKLSRLLRDAQIFKGTTSEAVIEFWKNSLLSAITTTGADVASSVGYGSYVLFLERGVEAAVNLTGGNKDTDAATFVEFSDLWKGMWPGLIKGIRNSWNAMRAETPQLQQQLGGDVMSGRFGNLKKAISGWKGRGWRFLGYTRLLMMDEFTQTLVANMEVSAQARRIGLGQGMKPGSAELIEAMQGMVADTNSLAWGRALDVARRVTFQQKGTKAAQAFKKGASAIQRSSLPGAPLVSGHFLVPFATTPVNILEAGLTESPMGIFGTALAVRHAMKTGDRRGLTKKKAQQIIAWAAVYMLWSLNDEDEPWITGSKGSDDYDSPKQSTFPSQSFRVPGYGWVSYARIEPFSTSIAAAIDITDAIKSSDPLRMIADPLNSVFNSLANKSYVQVLGDIQKMFEYGIEEGSLRWASSFAASWVPNLARHGAKNINDKFPERRIWGENLEEFAERAGKRALQKTEIPQLFGKFPDQLKIDMWGRTIRRATSPAPDTDFFFRMLVPTSTKLDRDVFIGDKVLTRWNMMHPDKTYRPSVPAPSMKLTIGTKKVGLTERQYSRFLRESGRVAREIVEGARLDWRNPKPADIEIITRAITKGREFARKLLTEDASVHKGLSKYNKLQRENLSKPPPKRFLSDAQKAVADERGISWKMYHDELVENWMKTRSRGKAWTDAAQ